MRSAGALPDSVVLFAATFLALAYLLPNHAPPWMSFLQEALAAFALLLVAVPALGVGGRGSPWRAPEFGVLALLGVLLLQYAFGQIAFLQTAWMHGLYLLGLLVALHTGGALERRAPGQTAAVLLPALLIAAALSVALQFVQWLWLPPGETPWWIYRVVGARPAANLGQPNSLATLIVLALLAVWWAWRRATFHAVVACALAVGLLAGLALTQSRTGLLNALLVAGVLLFWHRRRAPARVVWPLFALAAFTVAAFAAYAPLSDLLGHTIAFDLQGERASVGVRPLAWRLFADAVLHRPLVGYGWGQTFQAEAAEALGHPALHRVFLSAHNLPLELALWNGLPIAGAALLGLAAWLWTSARRVVERADDGALVLVLCVGVPLVHAMLEFPLHYAYFLLPVGLAAGALGERVGLRTLWRGPAAAGVLLLLAAASGLGLTVRDYLRVEQSYRDLLTEKARIVTRQPGMPPDVLVLTSLRELIVFSRAEPQAGLSAPALAAMQDVALTHPGAAGFEKLARALALNGRAAEAQRWVDRLCSIFTPEQCSLLAQEWAVAAAREPALRPIRWP